MVHTHCLLSHDHHSKCGVSEIFRRQVWASRDLYLAVTVCCLAVLYPFLMFE